MPRSRIPDNLLRFQLRNRIRQLKKDDQDIIWEGLDSLDKEELQMACMERDKEELSALESLAFKSLVEKERQTVSQLKQTKYDMDVEGLLAAGRIGAEAAENKTTGRMMKKLESMLSNLEVEIEEVGRHIGDRLNILDRDSDGVLSTEELRDAVMTILRKANTQEDVEWVISHIDEDNDGKSALEELVPWIAKCRESLEATGRIALQEPSDVSVEAAAAAETEKTKVEKAEKAKVKRANSRKKKEKEQ